MTKTRENQLSSHRLQTGLLVSVSTPRSRQDLPATVANTSAEGVWLEFLGPSPATLFQEGDRAWIKCMDENGMYCWDSTIIKLKGKQLALARVPGEGVTIQRRSAPRFLLKIPVSFTIMHSTERRVVSRDVFYGKTEHVSGTGLLFQTRAPLTVGDHLQVKLRLSSSLELDVVARVVRLDGPEEGKSQLSAAVQFLGMRPEEHEQLSTFIAERE